MLMLTPLVWVTAAIAISTPTLTHNSTEAATHGTSKAITPTPGISSLESTFPTTLLAPTRQIGLAVRFLDSNRRMCYSSSSKLGLGPFAKSIAPVSS